MRILHTAARVGDEEPADGNYHWNCQEPELAAAEVPAGQGDSTANAKTAQQKKRSPHGRANFDSFGAGLQGARCLACSFL